MLQPVRPSNVHDGMFHRLVFGLRAALWLIPALFVFGHPYDLELWVIWVLLMLTGVLFWNARHHLSMINQVLIPLDLVFIALAVHLSGGLASQAYVLYGGEALFLTAYGTIRYSIGGAIAIFLSYGLGTGDWGHSLFWWRVLLLGIYMISAGALGEAYRNARQINRENLRKIDRLSQLKFLQESIVKDEPIDTILQRLLHQGMDLVNADAAYVVRADEEGKLVGMSALGIPVATPEDLREIAILMPAAFEHMDDMRQSPLLNHAFHGELIERGYVEVAMAPLRDEGRGMGWICFAVRPGIGEGLADQSVVIEGLAEVVATQIRYWDARDKADKRGRLLVILERVGRIVNRNLEMMQLLRALHGAVDEELQTDSFFVALTLPDDPEHVLMRYLVDDGEEYPPELFEMDAEGLTGSVIVTGESLILHGQTSKGQLTGTRREPEGTLVVPLIYEGRVLGAMSAQSYRRQYDPDHLDFLSAVASQASIAIRNAQMYQQTQAVAMTDYLTGMGNSRQFNLSLQASLEKADETEQPLSLILIDSDSLKRINDQHGHRAGDAHLQMLADVIRESIREDDVACRYAGDEFVVILPKSQLDDALQVGERIRREMEFRQFIWDENPSVGATISVGVATYQPGMTADDLFQAADRAMYQVKKNGKNRVGILS